MADNVTTRQAARPGVPAKAAPLKWLPMAAGACALGAGLIFLAGALALSLPEAGGLPAVLRGNWLITIFRLQAGDAAIQPVELYRLNALDIALLGLAAATHAGLYSALRKSRRVLALIAVVQPPLGILLFLLTHSAGRCALMGAGLVISIAMLGSRSFGKWTSWMGLLSSTLLLAGDFGVGAAPSSVLAISAAIGYLLLTGWLFVVGRNLMQRAR